MRLPPSGIMICAALGSVLSLQAGAKPPAAVAKPAAPKLAAAKTGVSPERIEVHPSAVRLGSRRAYRQFVVTGYFQGEPRDLTDAAVFEGMSGKVAQMHGSRVEAVGDGQATLTVRVGGKTIPVPVLVTGTTKPDPIQFKFETLATLTKQGCATGSCHGSPHGKGGFSLSLFGYDPTIDRVSLTRDGFNRRVNILEPAESLMLKKPQLEIPHVGGKRLRKSDAAYRILFDWIQEGAHTDLPQVECERITLTPDSGRVLHAPFRKQQISVVASYTDGTTRDVSRIAAYESSHPAVAAVDANGLVTGLSRGQAAISVRYLDKLQSVFITVVEDVPGFVWNNPPENNFIDRLVDSKLKQLQYLPSETCSDSVFLRRISLDLTGLLPPPEKARQFLNDPAPDKRSKLIDALLGTEEFARFQALKQADLMRVTPGKLKEGRADLFARWLVDSVRANEPYDRFVREILTASGDTRKVAQANYFLAIPSMEERTEMTTELFMGSRLECSKCHNHPFENWTMRDYYRIGAVFARTQEKNGLVQLARTGEAVLPTTQQVMKPYGLAQGQELPDTEDRRTRFAEWLTRPGNPFFARVEVNRLWADMMGRGIVEPVDDFRSSNPPANVSLLDALAKEFEQSGYDRKHILRLICSSRAYQRSSQTSKFNAADETLFSHARVRLLTAEQMKDAIGLATRTLPYPGSPADPQESRMQYATQRPYPEHSGFTVTFGQPQRDTACTCERQKAPTLLQALELLNGGTAYQLAQNGVSHYVQMDDERLIEELYLSALCRFPTDRERDVARKYLKKGGRREDAVMDLIWAVVNMQEFVFQH